MQLPPLLCMSRAAQDLSRACVEYADAVVIIAPKHSTDPTAADRCIGMMVLALGQYLQDAHAVMQQQLLHWPQRMRHWLQHNTVRQDWLWLVWRTAPSFQHWRQALTSCANMLAS